MERRNFLRNVLTAGIVLTAPFLAQSCKKDEDDILDNENGEADLVIDLDNSEFANLKTAGNHVIRNQIIVANTGSGFIALSSVCTHQGCSVSYSESNNNLPCPCHGSVFSTAGEVVNGPANTPLKVYNVAQEGNILTITS